MAKAASPVSLRFLALDLTARLVLPLAGVGLLMWGIFGFVTFAVLPVFSVIASTGWAPVEATVEHIRVDEAEYRIPFNLKRVELQYVYTVDGNVYTGTRVGPHRELMESAQSRTLLEDTSAGEKIVVWVHRKYPARATASRDLQWGIVARSLVVLLVAAVGGIMVVAGMFLWSDRRSPLRRRRLR